MALINVNPEVKDAFYRYKMPRIIAKVEGKGNGIKTVIVNMSDVAKSLCRPPTYPCKFFGCELGAQTQFDTKNDRYIVNGSHDAPKLQELLGAFIKRFVLCDECDNPETIMSISQKKQVISMRCQACGHQGMADMRHKLTTFILKNPPDQDPSAPSATPNKKDKKGKKGKKEVNGEASPEATKQGGAGDKLDPSVVPAPVNNDDEVDWGEDTSKDAVARRMADLSSAIKNTIISDDVEKTQGERVDLFYNFVKQRKEMEQLTGSDKVKEIVTEAERLEVRDKAPMVLVEILYDTDILKEIKLYRTLFLRFTSGNPKAQKYLLGGFEQLVGDVHKDKLMPKVAHILKSFYDMDILDEEVLVEWDKKASKKYVSKEVSKEIHEKATPFIKWLKEAEEETSDSEEEEDEDVEVVYSHTERTGEKLVVSAAPKADQDDEDEFDIDAI